MYQLIRYIGIALLLCAFFNSEAQTEKKRPYQLTGIVLGEDSVSALPGVNVYVPRRLDGTATDYYGYFSLPVIEGDSVVFSSIGYIPVHYIVPAWEKKTKTLLIEMVTDTTYLDEVQIMSFPTEEIFKELVLALKLPPEEEVDDAHLNQELLTLMMRSAPMDANMNYRFYMDELINQQTYRGSIRPNPFLNPFNWAKFIRDIKAKNK